MGCLKAIFKNIIIILLIVVFFAFGGYSFLKKKINEYKNPSREKFVQSEKSFGDFSNVSSDYQLSRNFNFFGYKKITAKYLPTGQKISIIGLKNQKLISANDDEINQLDKKIKFYIDKTKDSIITFEDFKVVEKGNFNIGNQKVPYIRFESNIKNIPFKTVAGMIAVYFKINQKHKILAPKLIFTMTDLKAFNFAICRDFIENIKF